MNEQNTSDLQEGRCGIECVARFEHQVTGVTVPADNRILVNFPRWTEDAPLSVAEVLAGGSVKPYPDDEWNAWRNAKKDALSPEDHWVCVQSVAADGRGSPWVLDPAAPAQSHVLDGGPQLVRIEPATNKVKQTIAFGEDAAPQGSYLNDVRFSNDGAFAYLTDSGVKGAIVVVDIESGKALRGAGMRGEDVSDKVDTCGLNGVNDGLLIARGTKRMLLTAVQENAIKMRDLDAGADAPPQTLVQDARLRWPDTFGQGPDGTVYVTTSHIQDCAFFKPDAPSAPPPELWKPTLGQAARQN